MALSAFMLNLQFWPCSYAIYYCDLCWHSLRVKYLSKITRALLQIASSQCPVINIDRSDFVFDIKVTLIQLFFKSFKKLKWTYLFEIKFVLDFFLIHLFYQCYFQYETRNKFFVKYWARQNSTFNNKKIDRNSTLNSIQILKFYYLCSNPHGLMIFLNVERSSKMVRSFSVKLMLIFYRRRIIWWFVSLNLFDRRCLLLFLNKKKVTTLIIACHVSKLKANP